MFPLYCEFYAAAIAVLATDINKQYNYDVCFNYYFH